MSANKLWAVAMLGKRAGGTPCLAVSYVTAPEGSSTDDIIRYALEISARRSKSIIICTDFQLLEIPREVIEEFMSDHDMNDGDAWKKG